MRFSFPSVSILRLIANAALGLVLALGLTVASCGDPSDMPDSDLDDKTAFGKKKKDDKDKKDKDKKKGGDNGGDNGGNSGGGHPGMGRTCDESKSGCSDWEKDPDCHFHIPQEFFNVWYQQMVGDRNMKCKWYTIGSCTEPAGIRCAYSVCARYNEIVERYDNCDPTWYYWYMNDACGVLRDGPFTAEERTHQGCRERYRAGGIVTCRCPD